MKSIKKISFAILLTLILCVAAMTSVSADEALISTGLLSTESDVTTALDEKVVSCGLYVIAEHNKMTMTGIKGNMLNFSPERFACALNLSRVDHITVTKLPDVAAGSLYVGSEGVSVGQKLSATDISLMTYE